MKFLKLISWNNWFFFPGRYFSAKTWYLVPSFSKQQYTEILETTLSKCKCYLEMPLDNRKKSLWARRFICIFWTSGKFPALTTSPACTMILFVPRNNIIRFTAEQQREGQRWGNTVPPTWKASLRSSAPRIFPGLPRGHAVSQRWHHCLLERTETEKKEDRLESISKPPPV